MWTVGAAKGTLKFIQNILVIWLGSMQAYVIANAVIHSDHSNLGDKDDDKRDGYSKPCLRSFFIVI